MGHPVGQRNSADLFEPVEQDQFPAAKWIKGDDRDDSRAFCVGFIGDFSNPHRMWRPYLPNGPMQQIKEIINCNTVNLQIK